MELILKEDVENLGFKDDVVKVKNGFGRNFLIPNGLAMLATESNKKVLAEKIKQSQNKQKEAISDANKIVKKLEKLDLKLKAKSVEGEKIFGSITNSDISKGLNDNGIEIEKKSQAVNEFYGRCKYSFILLAHKNSSCIFPFRRNINFV